jgi:outer membrane biosynthesis protein TonB
MRAWLLAVILFPSATSAAAGQIPLRPVPQLASPSTPTGEAPAPHRIVPLEGACFDEHPHEEIAPAGHPYIEAAVDRPPDLVRPGPRRYPTDLELSGVGGRVVLSFVIDTLGLAEPCSFHVLSATNSSFEVAAFRMVLGSLFRPGEVRGQKVRVLVTQAISFNP